MSTPSPFCPCCDRLLSLAEVLLAEDAAVPCMDCLIDATESGKVWAYVVEEEHADAA